MRMLEKLMAEKRFVKAVIYARFSSDNQREESIDAQIRAIKDFADKNDIVVVKEYIDRAKSATTDQRPAFQQMIKDSKDGNFDIVLVHKLDRFARNRLDSIGYRMELKKNGVTLISILEQFDSDSPESIITESVLEAMAEYYSLNLAREIRKGQKENAYRAMWTGGTPPLGYDVDPATKKLVLNDKESKIVELIFKRYIEGEGYLAIANELNNKGYRTKKGNEFTKNSLFSVLSNEKYIGNYIFDRSASKDLDGKRNGHKYKNDEDIVRIEGAVPPIISKDDFYYVQKKREKNKSLFIGGRKIETYLLSGKIFCGECGSIYCGDRRVDKRGSRTIVKYVCNNLKRSGKKACSSRAIQRDLLETYVLDKLSENIFDDSLIPDITEYHNNFKLAQNKEYLNEHSKLENDLKKIEKDIDTLVTLITRTPSESIMDRITKLEDEKAHIRINLSEHEYFNNISLVSEYEIARSIDTARKMLKNKLLSNLQKIVELFVDKVIIYEDRVEVKFTFTKTKNPHLTFDLEKNKNNLENENPPDENLEDGYINGMKLGEKNRDVTNFTSRGGGERGIRTLGTFYCSHDFQSDFFPQLCLILD
jgi:site-specific DNA recombinase